MGGVFIYMDGWRGRGECVFGLWWRYTPHLCIYVCQLLLLTCSFLFLGFIYLIVHRVQLHTMAHAVAGDLVYVNDEEVR